MEKRPRDNKAEKGTNENNAREEDGYRFGTGLSAIDGNILSAPDIERAVNGRPLSDETEDDKIY